MTDAPPSLRRAIGHAAGALLLPWLLGVLLRMAGADMAVFITATIVAGVVGIAVVGHSLVGRSAWPILAAILIFAIVPFLAVLVLSENRVLGLILRVPVEQAERQPFAAGFLLTDGAVPRSDLRQVETVVDRWQGYRTGPGHRQDTYVVAPVVPPGWTPDQPVRVVAILASRHELSRRVPDDAGWAAPGGLLRTLDDELTSRAVRRALERGGLVRADYIVIGTWVPAPGWARLEAAAPTLALLGTALLAWIVVLLLDRRGTATPRRS